MPNRCRASMRLLASVDDVLLTRGLRDALAAEPDVATLDRWRLRYQAGLRRLRQAGLRRSRMSGWGSRFTSRFAANGADWSPHSPSSRPSTRTLPTRGDRPAIRDRPPRLRRRPPALPGINRAAESRQTAPVRRAPRIVALPPQRFLREKRNARRESRHTRNASIICGRIRCDIERIRRKGRRRPSRGGTGRRRIATLLGDTDRQLRAGVWRSRARTRRRAWSRRGLRSTRSSPRPGEAELTVT